MPQVQQLVLRNLLREKQLVAHLARLVLRLDGQAALVRLEGAGDVPADLRQVL